MNEDLDTTLALIDAWLAVLGESDGPVCLDDIEEVAQDALGNLNDHLETIVGGEVVHA